MYFEKNLLIDNELQRTINNNNSIRDNLRLISSLLELISQAKPRETAVVF